MFLFAPSLETNGFKTVPHPASLSIDKDDTLTETDGRADAAQSETTRTELTESLMLGRSYLLACQLDSGLFRYHFNYITNEDAPRQSPVRQAGALWGLALIHQEMPSDATRQAVLKGIQFFERCSRLTSDGRRFVAFPGSIKGRSGTVALLTLTLIDFLSAEPAESHPKLRNQLQEYLTFLQSLERYDHCCYAEYDLRSGIAIGDASPYFDGEILLAFVKAARLNQDESLQRQASRMAAATYSAYAAKPVRESLDAPDTKGYFQWACMAFGEISDDDWPESDQAAERTIRLAHWMIDVHRTLERKRNTAYALEGIIVAHRLAKATKDIESSRKFRDVISHSLSKLTTWQLGSSRPNEFLRQNPATNPRHKGGVLRASDSPWLRIDVTQHQMHAVILARRHIWTETP